MTPQPIITGHYSGTVYNATANMQAGLEAIFQQVNGTVYGCVQVYRPLYGSGPFRGVVSGSQFVIDLYSVLGRIRFAGNLAGNDMQGGYVSHSAQGNQTGTFSMRRNSSAGLPQDSTCEAVRLTKTKFLASQ